MRGRRAVACMLLVAGAGTGCAADDAKADPAGAGATVRIVASFYPLQWVAERVAGDAADVEVLTKPGAEPHDLELSPRDVATVADADLVVYLRGFQPSVDEAVEQETQDNAFDVTGSANLSLTYRPSGEGEGGEGTDPHFWLDPLRLADVGDALANRLAELSPEHSEEFTSGARSLRVDLEALDADLDAGLRDCTSRDLVTSHNAFGYLAQRYDLEQVGITGITPEDEPSPADLAAAAQFVQTRKVRTIYSETLVSPATARTVAAETGAKTAVLDPLEGLTDESEGSDYLEVMRSNLATLQEGQPCR